MIYNYEHYTVVGIMRKDILLRQADQQKIAKQQMTIRINTWQCRTHTHMYYLVVKDIVENHSFHM